MKKIFLSALLAILVVCGVAFSEYFPDVIVTSPNGIWTDTRAYTTLNAAITAIGANVRDVYIVRSETVTDLTIPANVSLHFYGVGAINNTGQLSLQTYDIKAGNRQIFPGTGEIDFARGTEIRSIWFPDLHRAFDATLDNYVTMIISNGWAGNVDADCVVGDNVTLKWEGSGHRIVINAGFTLSNIRNINAGSYQIFGGSGDLDFLDGARLRLSWFPHLRSVLTWVETERVTIVVDGTHVVDYSDTATANEYFDFDSRQGLFSLSAGVTHTTYSPDNNIASPGRQIYTGDGLARFSASGTFHPGWWGALGIAADDYEALQACIDSYKALMASLVTAGYYYDNYQGPKMELIGGRVYVTGTSLDTGGITTSSLKWLNGNGATIVGKTTDEPVIVNTGGHVWWWKNLTIEGDSVAIPSCGIYLARNDDGSGAGQGHFENITIVGSFTYAPVYNYASELNTWTKCNFITYVGQSSFILTSDNNRTHVPTEGNTPYTGDYSSTTQSFRDCEFYTADQSAGVLTLYSALEIDGFSNIHAIGCEFNTTYGTHGGTAPNRPQVLIKGTSRNPEEMAFDSCLFHAEYQYAIKISGATIVPKRIRLVGNDWGSTTNNPDNNSYQVYADDAAILINCYLEAPNVYLGAVGADALDNTIIKLNSYVNEFVNASNQHTVNINAYFEGEIFCDSTDSVTISATADRFEGKIHYTDIGITVPYRQTLRNVTTVTHSEASTVDLQTITLPANLLKPFSSWMIRGSGTMTGTGGDKTVTLYIGTATYTIVPTDNYGNGSDYVFEVFLTATAAAVQRGHGVSWIDDNGTPAMGWVDGLIATTQDSTAAIVIKCTGTLSNAADTLTQTQLEIIPQ